MNGNRFPWTYLWTIAFSGGGIWLLVREMGQYTSTGTASPYEWFSPAVILLGAALLIALWQAVLYISHDIKGSHQTINDPGMFYERALSRMWSQKWIPCIFLIIAGINALGMLANDLTIRPRLLADRDWVQQVKQAEKMSPPASRLISRIPATVNTYVARTPSSFFPDAGLGMQARNSGLGLEVQAVVLLLLATLMFFRLGKIRSGGEKATALDLTLIIVVGVSVYVLVVLLRTGIPLTPRLHYGSVAAIAAASLWFIVQRMIIIPIMLGGILGSLMRKHSDEPLTVQTFMEDAAKHFASLAVISAIATIVQPREYMFLLPRTWRLGTVGITHNVFLNSLYDLAIMLMMFAPYAVAQRGLGTLEGIKASWRLWLSNAGRILPFIAFGITLLTALWLVTSIPFLLMGRFSPLRIILMPIYQVIGALISAFLLLAVWELYREISNQPDAVKTHD